MMGLGFLTMVRPHGGAVEDPQGRSSRSGMVEALVIWTPLLPVFANSFGWIFTEIGRQPWLVNGLMTTATGVSPSVSAASVWISMIVYTLLYGALAVVEIKLLHRLHQEGRRALRAAQVAGQMTDDTELQFAY
jgi:cytochrome d ubiquinol oxidase subunit I